MKLEGEMPKKKEAENCIALEAVKRLH